MHHDVSINIACEQAIGRCALYNDRQGYVGRAALFTVDGVLARPSAPDASVRGRETPREMSPRHRLRWRNRRHYWAALMMCWC